MEAVVTNILLSIVFAVLGFLLLFVGYRIFDALTPTDLNKKIFEEGNLAVGILAGAFIIGIALVVSASVS